MRMGNRVGIILIS